MSALLLAITTLALADEPESSDNPEGTDETELPGPDTDLPPPAGTDDMEPAGSARTEVHIGGTLGLFMPRSELGAGLSPNLIVGVRPGFLGHRIGFLATATRTSGNFEGTGNYTPLGGDYDYTLSQRAGRFGVGVIARVLGTKESVSPELFVVPEMVISRTITTASNEQYDMGTTGDVTILPGVHLGAGVAANVGAGALLFRIGYLAGPARSLLAGDVPSGALLTTVGYRVHL